MYIGFGVAGQYGIIAIIGVSGTDGSSYPFAGALPLFRRFPDNFKE
jgi:hypothetical protein